MAVKAALFDVILGIDTDGEKACVAIERHEAAERRRLVYLAAASDALTTLYSVVVLR